MLSQTQKREGELKEALGSDLGGELRTTVGDRQERRERAIECKGSRASEHERRLGCKDIDIANCQAIEGTGLTRPKGPRAWVEV